MKKPTEWKVGEQVYLRDVNENRQREPNFTPPIVTISKVGRTLVFSNQYNREKKYRKEDGVAQDGYSHSRLQTFADYEEQKAISSEKKRIQALGLKVESKDFTSTDLCRIANLLEVIRKGEN